MTEVLDQPLPTYVILDEPPTGPPASWSARVGAFAVDVLPGVGLLAVVVINLLAAPRFGWLWWLCAVLAVIILTAIVVNRIVLPALTGSSVGRSLFGIAVVRPDGTRPGVVRLLVRELAHVFDIVPPLGWLWPLWDDRGRTFADIAAGTEARRTQTEPPGMRRVVSIGLAAAAALALLVTALGYLAVYRPDRAVEQARAEIAAQGPKIVAKVLSYGVSSVDEDFARAQGLVAEGYRPQILAQQEAVRKAGPVDNEYWATNSAVLSSSRDRADMLLLMHGQRGAAEKQRLITATLRVAFEKSSAGTWQVSNIGVLTAPNTAREER